MQSQPTSVVGMDSSTAVGRIILLTDEAEFRRHGLPWRSRNEARWAYRRRHENGLAGAFVTIGRRVAVDVLQFHKLVRRV